MEGDAPQSHQNSEPERSTGGHGCPPPRPPDQGKLGANRRNVEDSIPVFASPEPNDEVLGVVAADPDIIIHHTEAVEEELAHHGRRNWRSGTANDSDKRIPELVLSSL